MAATTLLNKNEVDYMHPEIQVKSADGTALGRKYLIRPPAPETEDDDPNSKQEKLLDEMNSFSKFAVDYLHPAIEAKKLSGDEFGRNYFKRS